MFYADYSTIEELNTNRRDYPLISRAKLWAIVSVEGNQFGIAALSQIFEVFRLNHNFQQARLITFSSSFSEGEYFREISMLLEDHVKLFLGSELLARNNQL